MAENSKIEWCHHTFNPWFGCTKVSEGCAHCYAEQSSPAKVALHKGHETWGRGAPRIRTSAANWQQPLKWDREAAAAWENWVRAVDARAGDSGPMPKRPRVFCASLADWLDDEVPIEWLVDLLGLIERTPNLDWLLLTKRPQNFKGRMNAALKRVLKATGGEPCNEADFIDGWVNKCDTIPANVWIGTTVENQARADERIPQLLSIPAKMRFLSCEPLLGPVDLHSTHIKVETWRVGEFFDGPPPLNGIHWVICGGESGGPKARPMHPAWARSLRDQCSAAGVPFFFKQTGDWACITEGTILAETTERPRPWHCLQPDDRVMGNALMRRVGKKKAGRVLDGRTHDEFPKVERGTGA